MDTFAIAGHGPIGALSLAHPFAGRPGCFEVGLRLEVQGHHVYTTHNRFGASMEDKHDTGSLPLSH